jgi:hypothetical protein
VTCSCCAEENPTVALRSRDDVELCRDDVELCRACLEWLVGQIGVTSTPNLPVVDMAEAVGFYETRRVRCPHLHRRQRRWRDGFALVDYDGRSGLDLDAAAAMDGHCPCVE